MNDKENSPAQKVPDMQGIDRAFEAHRKEWMAIPGVVGCYTTLAKDGRPCIRIMIEKRNSVLEKKIPPSIEGYPIELEESGAIQPLGGDSAR